MVREEVGCIPRGFLTYRDSNPGSGAGVDAGCDNGGRAWSCTGLFADGLS